MPGDGGGPAPPLRHDCATDTWDGWSRHGEYRQAWPATCRSSMVKARLSHLRDLSPLLLFLFPPSKHKMRWPFGIKEVMATTEVARRPSKPAPQATPRRSRSRGMKTWSWGRPVALEEQQGQEEVVVVDARRPHQLLMKMALMQAMMEMKASSPKAPV